MTRKIRPIRIEGNVAFVTLTKGYEAVIDAADAADVGRWCWHAKIDGSTVYAARTAWFQGKSTTILLHRYIMMPSAEDILDHVNMDGLDNRRANLRLATRSQNIYNQRLKCTNTSGTKGVCFNKQQKKWCASINLEKKRYFLGYHDTIELAAAAVALAREAMHGEFGRAA